MIDVTKKNGTATIMTQDTYKHEPATEYKPDPAIDGTREIN